MTDTLVPGSEQRLRQYRASMASGMRQYRTAQSRCVGRQGESYLACLDDEVQSRLLVARCAISAPDTPPLVLVARYQLPAPIMAQQYQTTHCPYQQFPPSRTKPHTVRPSAFLTKLALRTREQQAALLSTCSKHKTDQTQHWICSQGYVA